MSTNSQGGAMYELSEEHFGNFADQYAKRDPDLAQELRGRIARRTYPRRDRAAELWALRLGIREGEGRVEEGAAVPDVALLQRREAETIVRQHARPVMVIRDNKVTNEFVGPDSEVWASRVLAAQAVLDRVIPAIGRVEVNNNPDYQWVGTGWLVADDVIVTNRHVAREFGRLSSGRFAFRAGIDGGSQSARMDFLEEYGRSRSAEFAITSILWIAEPSEPDVAFLRVARLAGGLRLPKALDLAEVVNADETVVTIGYPARDSRIPDQDLVRSVFGDVYDKKRLAPGQVIAVSEDELEHDCSTLGGNSGSPVVQLGTGKVVGLHFAGVFMTANYAVPAPRIRELLDRALKHELPGTAPVPVRTTGTAPAAVSGSPSAVSGTTSSPSLGDADSLTVRLNVPIEVTVRVGGAAHQVGIAAVAGGGTGGGGGPVDGGGGAGGDGGSDDGRLAAAVAAARATLSRAPGVIEVRPGYRFKRGWITRERVIVVEVRKKMEIAELRATGTAEIPREILGVGIDVRTAALADQLESLHVSLDALEAPPRPGAYREPRNLALERVTARMRATFHVSPDSGFPNLKAFLGRVHRHLTATMYEWDVNHVSAAVAAAVEPDGRSLLMVTQRKGTQEAVSEMQDRLGSRMRHAWAWVGSGGLVPSAYHIKVASRDGEEFWLSSGNWKDSNQPDIDPAGEDSTRITPLRKYNREWHAIIANGDLATVFQRYIEWDYQESRRAPAEEAIEQPLPDLFVPEAAFSEGPELPLRARYFDPLEIDRELDVQPLLTPDRDDRGRRLFMSAAVAMAKRARETLLIENQSFNILPENVDEFEEFFSVVRAQQQAGVDVRIIFRDPREFGASGGAKLQKMLETIRDFGIDTDRIKVQRRCHTKAIIVDDREVLFGSHNLTNQGALYNRDASLLVRDAEVARYFREIFEYDWMTLAVQDADEMIADVRLAMPGEATPEGFRRVPLRDALGLI